MLGLGLCLEHGELALPCGHQAPQLVGAALLTLLATGCPAKTHCQSGAKHGTQCYDHDSGYTTNDTGDTEEPRSVSQTATPETVNCPCQGPHPAVKPR